MFLPVSINLHSAVSFLVVHLFITNVSGNFSRVLISEQSVCLHAVSFAKLIAS